MHIRCILVFTLIECVFVYYGGFAQTLQSIPIVVDSISPTTVRLRWARDVVPAQSVYTITCFSALGYPTSILRGQDAVVLTTRDTMITIAGLRANQLYGVTITNASVSLPNSFPLNCVSSTAFTTLSERFAQQIQSGAIHQWNGFVVQQAPRSDSTYYQLRSQTLDSLGYLTLPMADRFLERMIDAGIAIDTAWVETGYGGLSSACSRFGATVSYPGNLMIKLSRRNNRVEEFGFRYPEIFSTPSARQNTLNGETRRYVFGRIASVQSGAQLHTTIRISPQPLSGAGLLTLMVQRPIIADIRVVNMLGQTVATLAQARQFFAGETVISWSAEMLSSGMYAVQFLSGGRILHTQNVVVAR